MRQMSQLFSVMFSLFSCKVLKVSFNRTLVVELTPESLFENHHLSPSESRFGCRVSVWLPGRLLGAELSKPPVVEQCPQG